MVERQRPIVQNADNSVDRRERISDEEMGNLLAAFGNHEAKALTLLLMRPRTIYVLSELGRMINSAQGENPGWTMKGGSPFNYCFQSLAPIGLVAREVTDNWGIYGYEKTKYGEKIGDPLAALLLDYSLSHDLSLYQVFGQTLSSSKFSETNVQEEKGKFKKRSPATRLKILKDLLTNEVPVKESDIVKKVSGEQSSVQGHLVELKRQGIITLESRDRGVPFSFYRLSSQKPEGNLDSYRTSPTLTGHVYSIISSSPSKFWTIPEVTKRLREMGKSVRTDKSLKADVSGVLNHLRRRGYLEVGEFSHEVESKIGIREEFRDQIRELVELIDFFQSGGPETIARGERLARMFRSGAMELEIAKLMAKAKENSPAANKAPIKETALIIMSILQEREGTTVTEIRNILERQSDRRLTMESVGYILRDLKSKGLVLRDKTKSGMAARWVVNPQAVLEASNSFQAVV